MLKAEHVKFVANVQSEIADFKTKLINEVHNRQIPVNQAQTGLNETHQAATGGNTFASLAKQLQYSNINPATRKSVHIRQPVVGEKLTNVQLISLYLVFILIPRSRRFWHMFVKLLRMNLVMK